MTNPLLKSSMLMGVTEWAPFDEYKFKVTGVVNLPLFGDKVFCNSDTISKGYFVKTHRTSQIFPPAAGYKNTN